MTKELWSVPEGTIGAGDVYHTMGFSATDWDVFGGGFIYGLKDNKVAIGQVLGLEAANPTFDTFKAFQADVIVSGGRGTVGDGLKLVQQLAQALKDKVQAGFAFEVEAKM
ncbi:hypothetical protein FACS1894160_0020 [Bacteroidia bacterium]|nr:hypothetical protein FACS1894123_03700 [Bacteroidia bacterium]GHV07445.1 hypothetical protein FACS1894160_0020 [Bacteroidia bacterium]